MRMSWRCSQTWAVFYPYVCALRSPVRDDCGNAARGEETQLGRVGEPLSDQRRCFDCTAALPEPRRDQRPEFGLRSEARSERCLILLSDGPYKPFSEIGHDSGATISESCAANSAA